MSRITDWVDKNPGELKLESTEHIIKWRPRKDGSLSVFFEQKGVTIVCKGWFDLDHDEAVKAARWLSENWLEKKV